MTIIPLKQFDALTYFLEFLYHLGADLLSSGSVVGESLLKDLWQHQDAILCCSLKP
ncbi:hypothetical protein HanXRQr2_Chr12g0523991 [Helianthus annuus]|uniref:Uncharacterized protein n=1 Tax=Helianthus annuus TaxID=4232 RepID=A0A9K3HD21_HELAN|nr:hypothetical protein HanXRQr2_Chr12g0523991 [Helianthus annuus]